VSLELSSVCILNATGQIFREAKIASEPDALTAFLASLNSPLTRVGLEAGPLSQWLYAGLQNAGFEVVLLETRHVKAALSAMIVKTDRRDARGIAQLLHRGLFRPAHCKSPAAVCPLGRWRQSIAPVLPAERPGLQSASTCRGRASAVEMGGIVNLHDQGGISLLARSGTVRQEQDLPQPAGERSKPDLFQVHLMDRKTAQRLRTRPRFP
jgi:hypothetical protein